MTIRNLNEIPGKDMAATCSNLAAPDTQFEILVGSEALLAHFSVDIPQAVTTVLGRWKTGGKIYCLGRLQENALFGDWRPSDSPNTARARYRFRRSNIDALDSSTIITSTYAIDYSEWHAVVLVYRVSNCLHQTRRSIPLKFCSTSSSN